MGVKLSMKIAPLEASLENGIISIYFLDRIIKEVTVPVPKNIKIEKQCNYVQTMFNNIVVFLKNDKYTIIIRECGTMDVLNGEYVILHRGKMDSKLFIDPLVKVVHAGSISIGGRILPAYMALSSIKDVVFIFTGKTAMTLELDVNNKLNNKIKEWSLRMNDVGTMVIDDNRTNGSALWVNFGRDNSIVLKDYKLVTSSGVIGGIVV